MSCPVYKSMTVALLATLLALPGCLEREEELTVGPDGGVTMTVRYKGTADEFKTDDALPSAASGWPVKVETVRENNEEKQLRSATRTFAPGAALPRSYADPKDADAELALDFPTTVRVQRTAEGTYYHFKRTYSPRSWAYVRYWHDRFVNDEIKDLLKKEEKDLTEPERVKILKAFAYAAAHEQVEFAEEALRQVAPDLPQHHRLEARRAILDSYDAVDYTEFVRRYQAMPQEQREASFDKESDRMIDRAKDRLMASLRKAANLDGQRLAAFKAAYKRTKKRHDITDQTGSQVFKLRLKLPGKVVAHNADEVEEDGTLRWQFMGEAFRDRAFELMATAKAE